MFAVLLFFNFFFNEVTIYWKNYFKQRNDAMSNIYPHLLNSKIAVELGLLLDVKGVLNSNF